MVLNPPRMDSVPSHWMGYKEQGSAYFQREEYEDALASYRAALSPEYMCPSSEKQIVWSNIVACRLKIGGLAQAKAAVEDAKTVCVLLYVLSFDLSYCTVTLWQQRAKIVKRNF